MTNFRNKATLHDRNSMHDASWWRYLRAQRSRSRERMYLPQSKSSSFYTMDMVNVTFPLSVTLLSTRTSASARSTRKATLISDILSSSQPRLGRNIMRLCGSRPLRSVASLRQHRTLGDSCSAEGIKATWIGPSPPTPTAMKWELSRVLPLPSY